MKTKDEMITDLLEVVENIAETVEDHALWFDSAHS